MEWGWACVGVAVAVLVAWFVLRGGVYRRLFADGHFVEVAQALGKIKAAALDRVIVSEDDEARSLDDPRAEVTSAGLMLLYTVRWMGDRFEHHYSVSVVGGYTARAVGEMFILFAARLLGVPLDSLALGVGNSTVHHAEFHLTGVEHTEFAARPVAEVSPAEVAAFRRRWYALRRQLRWQRL